MPQFQKIPNLQNLLHRNKLGIICIEILVVLKLIFFFKMLQDNGKLLATGGNLWVVELGKFCTNVYRSTAAAPVML